MMCFGEKPRPFHCKIMLLDGTELLQEIQTNTQGQELLDIIFSHLNLVETIYFGLRFVDSVNQTHWLDASKKVSRQLKGNPPFTLYFGVKFYASDPCKLMEEITRYQFFLQVKQDILQGRLPVPYELSAELAAFAVQSELGDYDPRRHSPGYISEFRLVTNQTEDMESKIFEIHKTLTHLVPAMAELNYLEKTKWLDMYGVDLHPVLGEDNIEYFLGLTPSGVIVLRNKTKVGNYFWPRITKVYFKGRYFMIRVRDKNNEESTYGFELPTKQACKHLWKCCVEHHAFFRLMQVDANPVGRIFRLTSKFRYSGRTEQQAQSELQQIRRLPPQVTRVPSQRNHRRLPPTDGIDNFSKEHSQRTNSSSISKSSHVRDNASLSQSSSNMHRTASVPNVLPLSDSPRSTRSAPWEGPKRRGLYSSSTNPSPRSIRSTSTKHSLRHHTPRRSSSVDSESSCDGRQRRHSHHRRQNSDNGKDFPKSPRGSHHRNRKARSGSRHRDSGSESEARQKRNRNRRNRSGSGSNYELVDSEPQWQEIQFKQNSHPQSAVIKELNTRRSGYANSGMESESEVNYHQRRKHKRHSRSRSRSPSENKKILPEELRKHFDYNLVDTSGLSEDQLKNIPYTKVEVDGSGKPLKHNKPSPNLRQKPSGHRQGKGFTNPQGVDMQMNAVPSSPSYHSNFLPGMVNNSTLATASQSPSSSTRSHQSRTQIDGFSYVTAPSPVVVASKFATPGYVSNKMHSMSSYASPVSTPH